MDSTATLLLFPSGNSHPLWALALPAKEQLSAALEPRCFALVKSLLIPYRSSWSLGVRADWTSVSSQALNMLLLPLPGPWMPLAVTTSFDFPLNSQEDMVKRTLIPGDLGLANLYHNATSCILQCLTSTSQSTWSPGEELSLWPCKGWLGLSDGSISRPSSQHHLPLSSNEAELGVLLSWEKEKGYSQALPWSCYTTHLLLGLA